MKYTTTTTTKTNTTPESKPCGDKRCEDKRCEDKRCEDKRCEDKRCEDKRCEDKCWDMFDQEVADADSEFIEAVRRAQKMEESRMHIVNGVINLLAPWTEDDHVTLAVLQNKLRVLFDTMPHVAEFGDTDGDEGSMGYATDDMSVTLHDEENPCYTLSFDELECPFNEQLGIFVSTVNTPIADVVLTVFPKG